MTTETALAVQTSGVPLTAEAIRLATAAIKAKDAALTTFVTTVMKEKRDYGVQPGVTRPFLWLPGAERLALMGNLTVKYELLESFIDPEEGYCRFVFIARAYLPDGTIKAEAYASCDSNEKALRHKDGSAVPVNTVLQKAQNRAFKKVIRTALCLSGYFLVVDEDQKDYDPDTEATDGEGMSDSAKFFQAESQPVPPPAQKNAPKKAKAEKDAPEGEQPGFFD